MEDFIKYIKEYNGIIGIFLTLIVIIISIISIHVTKKYSARQIKEITIKRRNCITRIKYYLKRKKALDALIKADIGEPKVWDAEKYRSLNKIGELEGWIAKCISDTKIEEWIPIKLSRKEREGAQTLKRPRSRLNPNAISLDRLFNDTLVIGDMIITDKNPLIVDKIKNKQDYYMLICKYIVENKTAYYIYAPGLCSSKYHPVRDSNFMIHFTLEIKTSVEKYILELPKEISKEISEKTVQFPSDATRITI